jgi:hypothetical protein
MLGDFVKLGDDVMLSDDIICAGRTARRWEFLGLHLNEGLTITAGCRWFTSLSDARTHWQGQDEEAGKVDYIESEARRRGWI